jgi:type IX secretion system PorP/SprF family membrane protein
LDKKSDNVLTLGVQWGQVQRSLGNARGLLFQDMIELEAQTTTDNVLSNGKDPKKSFTDINAGLLFKSKLSKESDFNMGVSIRHITTPDHNFRGGAGDLPMRITAHGQYNTSLNGKWSLTPEVYYSSISNSRQFQLHGWTGYQLKPDIRLNGGLGYRFGDAGQVLLGMDYKDFKFALGYDVTLSELGKVNSHQGGFEVALSYIGKIYKKPVVKPAVLCPHL